MTSLNKLIKIMRRPVKFCKNRRLVLHGCPHKTGTLIDKILLKTPRKPNSGKRQVGKVLILRIMDTKMFVTENKKKQKVAINKKQNGNTVTLLRRLKKGYKHIFFARLPGNGAFAKKYCPVIYKDQYQNLKKNDKVLVRGGRGKDTPGIKYRFVHKGPWRQMKKRKTSIYALQPLPWTVFKQRRSLYGIRRKKYFILDNPKHRSIDDYIYDKDLARQKAGCLKKKTLKFFDENFILLNLRDSKIKETENYQDYQRQNYYSCRNKFKNKFNWF